MSKPRFFLLHLACCLVVFFNQPSPAQEPRQGVSLAASQKAVVNFSELAGQEALQPASLQPARIAPSQMYHPAGSAMTASGGASIRSRAFATQSLTAQSPAPAASFQALTDNNTSIPPDTHGAVGPNHLMVVHNTQVRIQTKTGTTISTVSLDGFWAKLNNVFTFDPKAYYDPFNNRWIFVACADAQLASSAVLIAVSQTSDPTGNWNMFRIKADVTGQTWADYPSVGFNKDWIVAQLNMFDNAGSGGFNQANFFIFNKADLYANGTGLFTLISNPGAFTVVPAVTYDNTLSTIYLIEDFNGDDGFGNGQLRLWRISGAVGAETLTLASTISAPAPWSDFPSQDAPQLGTPRAIAINDARMQNVVYRNGSLWCTHAVFLPSSTGARSAVQWWQLSPGGAVVQRGRIDDPTGLKFYGFPSLAVNKNNDMLIGYSRFGSDQFASANYSFRAGNDPLNTLQSEVVLKAGEASYFKTFGGPENRWGDYSNTQVDPANDLDMWTIQEYAALPVGGFDRWATWWGKLLLSKPPDGILEVTITPSAGTTLLSGSTVPFIVRVDDSLPVNNATVVGTIPGVFTNQPFLNNGVAPDAQANDDLYSANVSVPMGGTNITLTLTITAPGKFTASLTFDYPVLNLPPNDNFIAAIKIPDAGGVVYGTNIFATLETGEPLHANVPTVANSVWWYWAPTNSGPVLLDPIGSTFNTVLAVYTGNSVDALTAVASVDDVGGRAQGYLTFNATAGVTYRIAVAGFGALDSGSIRLRVEFNGQPDLTPPTVTITSPASGLVTTNGQITVAGTAIDPVANGSGVQNVLVAVNNNLPVNAVGTTNWTATVSLSAGSNTIQVVAVDFANNSSVAKKISVTFLVFDPPNDLFFNATTLTGASGVITNDTLKATKEVGEPNHAGKVGGKSVWYVFTAPTDGTLSLSTTNSTFDTLLAVYSGSPVGNLTPVASNDDAYFGVKFSALTQAMRSGQTYHIAVDGLDGASGIAYLSYAFNSVPIYDLIITNTAGGTVSLGTGSYANNSVVLLTATPVAGYDFVTWLGDVITQNNPISLVINGNVSLGAVFQPRQFSDDFETGNLLKLRWTNLAGTTPWLVTTNPVSAGKFAARSGVITHGGSSTLMLTANMRGGAGSFDYRVSSEAGGDFLEFFVNGTRLLNASGDSGWLNFSTNFPAGTNTLQWRYSKDLVFTAGLDAAFLDNVNLPFVVPTNSTSAANFSFIRPASGNVEFRFLAQTNQIYWIQASADLANWQTISTNIATHGIIQLIDPAASNFPARYYRAVVP